MMYKNILITGSSGFFGSLISEAHSKNYTVHTLARRNAEYLCDLSKEVPKFNQKFDVIIHAAGKAHSIPKTETEKTDFYDINLQGTKNLIAGLNENPPEAFVFISTVAVYGAIEGAMIDESHPLQAEDPYGRSKILAEKVLDVWCKEKGVALCILRLPLIIGGNAPGNFGAMIQAIKKNYFFNIGQGGAKKSMVLADDVIATLPAVFGVRGIYNLTDGYHPSFKEMSDTIATKLSKKVHYLPIPIAKILSFAGDLLGDKAPFNSDKYKKMSSSLTFDDTKARQEIGWCPKPVLSKLCAYV